jgi:hypothetical protein
MENENLKKEVLAILTSIFSEGVTKIIEDSYDSENPEELLKFARHILGEYMGETNADKILDNIIEKFPKMKGEVMH